MKTYKRIKNTNAAREIVQIIDRHEKFKSAYFWTPPASARGRRQLEQDNTVDLQFAFDGKTYEIEQEIRCSCRNVYYSLRVTVDGERKNIRALKKLIS